MGDWRVYNPVFGLIGLFVKTFTVMINYSTAAVLCGYIIPGHIANSEFKKTKQWPQ
jgi:hypothetical protein